MSYEVIRLASDQLSYREKMKLAQYLVQAAIKEEEVLNPDTRIVGHSTSTPGKKKKSPNLSEAEVLEYVKERLAKSKPSKTQSLVNFINAMFQFQGGIDDSDVELIIKNLKASGIIQIDGVKVIYE